MSKAPDWMIHYVFPEENDPDFLIDCHTHGLEKYGHLELGIVIALGEQVSCMMLNSLGERIRNGEKFEEGIRTDILKNEMRTRIVKEKFGDKEILILVFPDQNGLLPEDEGCEEIFNKQMEYIGYIKKNRY